MCPPSTSDSRRRLRFPGKHDEEWELHDPAGQDLSAIRHIRDEVEERVRHLLVRLAVGAPSTTA